MVDSLTEFFQKKGAVKLICVMDPMDSMRFKDFQDTLEISDPTISSRIGEAIDLELIKSQQESTEPHEFSRESHGYVLTDYGWSVHQWLKDVGLVQTYEQLRSIREMFSSQRENFVKRTRVWDTIIADQEITSPSEPPPLHDRMNEEDISDESPLFKYKQIYLETSGLENYPSGIVGPLMWEEIEEYIEDHDIERSDEE